jgi:hypothetical protein
MHTTRLSAASCLTLSTRTSIEALDETGVIESAEQLTTNAALMRELERSVPHGSLSERTCESYERSITKLPGEPRKYRL